MAATSPITLPIKADSAQLIATLDAVARHAKALADELRQINDPHTKNGENCSYCDNPLELHDTPCKPY